MEEDKKEILMQGTAIEAPVANAISETVAEVPISRSREWFQGKYPDSTWESEEQYDEALTKHLSDTDARLSNYAQSDERIARIIDLNPEFAMVLDAMDKGMPFRVALRRYAGDILADEPQEGDEDFEAYRNAAEEYLAQKRKTDEEIAQRNNNLEQSDKVFIDFVKSQGWPDKKQDDYVRFINDALNNLAMGVVSTEFLSMMRDAFTHDEDVADAKAEGLIEGKNDKITARRIKREEQNDGVPEGGGTGPRIEDKPKRRRPIDIGIALDMSDEDIDRMRKDRGFI